VGDHQASARRQLLPPVENAPWTLKDVEDARVHARNVGYFRRFCGKSQCSKRPLLSPLIQYSKKFVRKVAEANFVQEQQIDMTSLQPS
jgi:hypothetical protein